MKLNVGVKNATWFAVWSAAGAAAVSTAMTVPELIATTQQLEVSEALIAQPAPSPVPSTPEEAATKALKVGQTVPEGVAFRNSSGERVELATLLKDGPVVAMFYRGSWCPFCTSSLKQFEGYKGEIEAAGGRIIAVTPELPQFTAAPGEKHGVSFKVYSDEGLDAGRKFGVVYTDTRYGSRLAQFNGNDRGELPLGATYVIGTDGKIAWAFTGSDYKVRAKPEEALAAVKTLTGK